MKKESFFISYYLTQKDKSKAISDTLDKKKGTTWDPKTNFGVKIPKQDNI